jgi:hypothetical protein
MVGCCTSSPTLPSSASATLPLRVRLAAGLVGEGVEDAERRRAKADRVPDERGRLVVDERQRALEEPGDLLLLAGHGVEANEQSDSDHQALPSV